MTTPTESAEIPRPSTPVENSGDDPAGAALRGAGLRVTAPRRAVLTWLAMRLCAKAS